jgi:hypothetical protein
MVPVNRAAEIINKSPRITTSSVARECQRGINVGRLFGESWNVIGLAKRRFGFVDFLTSLANTLFIDMNDAFEQTTRPDNELFFTRNDSNDPRMGEIVASDPERYGSAAIVILGCPQDEGVRRRDGRVGAADAPRAIREQFYKLTTNGVRQNIFDLGDVTLGTTLEETHDTMTAVVTQLLKDGKRLIVLGGGNDISYADGVAVAEVFGPG